MRYFKSFLAQLALYVLGLVAIAAILSCAGMPALDVLLVVQILNLFTAAFCLGGAYATLSMSYSRYGKDEDS